MKLFRNALIVDGTGGVPYQADVLVQDGQIVQIGTNLLEANAQEVDLKGSFLTPGFIDSHSHNDWFCLRPNRETFFDSFLKQGITTMITGNCGFSASGWNADSIHQNQVGGELFQLSEEEKTPRFSDWMDRIHRHSSVNIASLLGHGSIRTAVAGLHQAELTPEQEKQVLDLLEKGLQDGASGISLGLMYAPGLFAPMSELEKVAKLVAKYDRILTIHPRAESAISLSYSAIGKSHLLLALDEVLELTKKADCRTVYSHLIFVGRRSWKDLEPALKKLEAAKAEGFNIGFDMYPFDYGASVITVVLPEWYQKLSKSERRKPLVILKLKVMIAATTKLLGFGFSDMKIAYAGEKHPEYNGQYVSEIAKQLGKTPFETYLQICEDSDFKARVLMGSYQNAQIVERLMKHPLSVYMTDAWYEEKGVQNEAIYDAFPTFFKLGDQFDIPIEKLVHKMSGLTAERYQLEGRGQIQVGYAADLVVLSPDKAVQQVYVNGELAYDETDGLQDKRYTYGHGLSLKKETS